MDEILATVKKTVPTVTRDSVYRILNDFAAIGLIARLDALSAARYDTSLGPHAHFICRICGAVSDINWLELPADTLSEVEQQTGSKVEDCRIAVTGVCADCAKKDAH